MDSNWDDLASKARKAAAEGGETVKEALSSLSDSEEWEQLRAMAGNLGEDAATFVRKYPLQSVAGAAALGFLLGMSIGKKR